MCSGYYSEELETFVEIPSDNCQFNEKPHMKAREITSAGKEALTSGKFQMVRVNYANPGMQDHTIEVLWPCRLSATCSEGLNISLFVAM